MVYKPLKSDLELMKIQIKTLFTHTANGRLQEINEPTMPPTPAPHFFLGRTRAGNVARFRHDLPGEIVAKLRDLVSVTPISTNLAEDTFDWGVFWDVLRTYVEIRRVWHGPAYHFPAKIKRPADVVPITQENAGLLRYGFAGMLPQLEGKQPCLAAIENGHAVSICCSVRICSQADEAGVETLTDYRGHGHAPRIVATWAAAVRALGRRPLYSTSWDNSASQRVAEKLGLILYGVDFHLT